MIRLKITTSVDNILFQYQNMNVPRQKKNANNSVNPQGSIVTVHQKITRHLDFLLNKYL